MLRRKYMTEKHIQMAKACIKMAKGRGGKREDHRKFWIRQAEMQVDQAKNLIKTM